MRRWLITASIALAWAAGSAALAAARPSWGDMGWLVGRWVGEGGGPMTGSGGFSFLPDNDGHVLVRRNVADYPPQNGKPALHHEDLVVIYHDGPVLKATYWDNEDQVIHYVVSATPQAVVFLSEPAPGPRFRLTYRRSDAGLQGQLEIAPPNDAEHFKPYLAWTARRAP